MAAATTLRGGSGGSNRSSNSSNSTTCTRVTPVITVSPSHTLEYDCTDCGSFLFGHRGRPRQQQQQQQPHSSSSNAAPRSSYHHSRGSSFSEPLPQAHAQRLFVIGPTPPFAPPTMPQSTIVVPQNEQLLATTTTTTSAEAENPVNDYGAVVAMTTGLSVSNDVSEGVSVQASEDEVEVVANERVMDFVACHGASPARADTVNDSSATLAEIFRCFICLGKVVDAQLCPCCSKLVCQPCIKRWLTDQKSECPHCRAPLLVSQLVSCRFISEISLEVEKIQGKLGDSPMEKYCPAHDSPLLYFCTTCAVAVCSDCAVLIEDHRNHTFEKLSVAYGRHKKKIRMEAAGLRKRRKELSALVASVDKNIETVLKSKDESAVELQMAFKRMQSRLEEQLKCKLLALLAQKGSMTQEMELLDTILHELDQQLNSIPKSDLIAQEPNMSRMLQDIRTRTFSDISRTPIPPEFTSEVVPSYEHGKLVLKGYKEALSQQPGPTGTSISSGTSNSSEEVSLSKEVVYSEPICASGVTWRLKVYPNGSGASQGTHLSVFLEMVEGGTEAATYEYGIELLHRTRLNQRIVRKFSSDFEEGACWGYYQFFRIDLLEKEGYLQLDEDTITLKFYVRPLTYQQQCQDLRRSLAALQADRDESATQVAVIRRAFAATFFQRRRRRSSRGAAGHAANAAAQAAFAQAVAAGAGMAMGIDNNIASTPALTLARKSGMQSPPLRMQTPPLVPSMKQLQLKMQEYNNNDSTRAPEKWLPMGCHLAAEESAADPDKNSRNNADPLGECPEDDAPEELVELRRKNRHHHHHHPETTWIPNCHTPKARAYKKLRSRKVHKLMLLAPESSATDARTTTTAGLVHHFETLSVMEAGPSRTSGATMKKTPGLNSAAPDVAECIDTVDAIDESANNTSYYNSSAVATGGGSSNSSFCTPEIEDWGNLMKDHVS